MKETNKSEIKYFIKDSFSPEEKSTLFHFISHLIIEKAIRDYIFALNGKHTGLTRYTSLAKDCENFFTSPWYEFLAHDYDGRKLVKHIKDNVQKNEDKGKTFGGVEHKNLVLDGKKDQYE